ncbi:uncharacterized protein LOC133444800 [Cololabis saira]|uniref:uncharacterized protein LOC133444800 n=1 Tax=Cololabis saira TaxID=129043 RepID=UPI002AD1E3BE|nr:uncharacterized protein LOC133444800 [Cololabis saira]
MEAGGKRALLAACALICSEQERKRKRQRAWVRAWIGGRGQQGLSVLQRELQMDDRSGFRELLRMTAEEFDFLLGKVEHLIRKRDTKMRLAISARERLSLTLRFLATGETFQSLRFQYRIGTSTVSQIVMETCTALHEVLKEDFLKTPSTEAEWRLIARDFQTKWQFPHCLGALDERHIHIQPPKKSGSLYHNHNGRFSVPVLAAVDANYRFIYVSVGAQGGSPHAGLFPDSDLCMAMDQDMLDFPPPEPLPGSHAVMPYVFVGDETYPLRCDLMKPYPDVQTDRAQRVLNYRLSRARRVVENAFGILANRLKIFRSTICLEPDKVVKITMASLCIHNFLCERRSEAYAPPAFADWETADHGMVDGAWRSQGLGALQPARLRGESSATDTATVQRNLLRDYLVSPVGSVPWQEQLL